MITKVHDEKGVVYLDEPYETPYRIGVSAPKINNGFCFSSGRVPRYLKIESLYGIWPSGGCRMGGCTGEGVLRMVRLVDLVARGDTVTEKRLALADTPWKRMEHV